MSQGTDKTYQMLWDCQYCSQKKNLGLTHRHCPNCGATQDTTTRYFPPDSEKVAVEDHPYVGADVLCPSCGNASSRAARCCGNCGGSLTGGRDVALVQAPQAPPPPQWQSASPPTSTWKWKVQYTFVILGAVLALFAGTCAFVFHKRSGAFEVKETHWERNITVEQLDMKRDSAWCDAVPSDGRILDRHDEERSTKQIPDGQTCTTTKKDQGNGTYKEVQECKPKYKSQSVYDKKCDFEAPRWVTLRTEKAQGGDGARQWPTL
ncbi:MAG TPA: hypothetical protein VNO21_10890, partial [Polyangiaceae bacterium]|nr:hypothetical protein [Polyangiaceae bacterium]